MIHQVRGNLVYCGLLPSCFSLLLTVNHFCLMQLKCPSLDNSWVGSLVMHLLLQVNLLVSALISMVLGSSIDVSSITVSCSTQDHFKLSGSYSSSMRFVPWHNPPISQCGSFLSILIRIIILKSSVTLLNLLCQ